jgi:hypothetical protein
MKNLLFSFFAFGFLLSTAQLAQAQIDKKTARCLSNVSTALGLALEGAGEAKLEMHGTQNGAGCRLRAKRSVSLYISGEDGRARVAKSELKFSISALESSNARLFAGSEASLVAVEGLAAPKIEKCEIRKDLIHLRFNESGTGSEQQKLVEILVPLNQGYPVGVEMKIKRAASQRASPKISEFSCN